MVCAQLIRNVVIILLLEVSFSFVIANGSKPGNPKQVKCAVISIGNSITKILNANKRNPQPVKVVKGNQLVSRGRSIIYICDDEYEMHGKDTLTCRQNGKWSPSPPVCLAPPQEVLTPTIRSTVTELLTTEEVETTPSGNPAVDEGLTTASDGLPSVATTLEKAKTSEAFRVITITVATRTPPLPIPTRVASSTVELHLPTSRPTTLKAEESTVVPSSTPAFSSFPDDVIESDTTASNYLDRITWSSLVELTEAQSTSTSEMFNQDEETKEPGTRVTETHQLFSEKSDEGLEEKVSTSDAYETTSHPFETEDSVVSSVEMVSEAEEEDDTTPEARDHSSVSGLGLKESEDDDAKIKSTTLESVYHYTAVPQELLTVLSNSPRIKVPIDEVETRRTPEESLSSFTLESEDFNLPFEHDFTETDSKGQRPLIVTHYSIKTTTESRSDETLVMTPKKIPTNENTTSKTRSRSQSVLTTHVPPSNPSGYKSTPRSAPTIDSVAMTGGSSASSIVLIIIIVAAVIILVVLLVILGKAFLPKCTLLQKPCHEQGAVPYTAQNNQTDQVVLKGINPTPENDRCTQV